MPLPIHPDDFPLNEDVILEPTKFFYIKGGIHFKGTAAIQDLTGKIRQPFDNFGNAFAQEISQVSKKLEEREPPKYQIKSCGEMMRTIKTMVDSSGEKVCDLNMTFVSFDNSYVRFPPGSKHSRHAIEMWPVDDRSADKHEAFVKNSIPYFWDMTTGPFGVLHKCLNQQRVEIAKVAAYGFSKDIIVVLNGEELDEVVALSTCLILLNGRDAMDH